MSESEKKKQTMILPIETIADLLLSEINPTEKKALEKFVQPKSHKIDQKKKK